VLLIWWLKPLPTQQLHLAMGQPGSSYQELAGKIGRYFKAHGTPITLVETPGLDQGLRQLQDEGAAVNASFITAGSASKGAFPDLVSLGSIKYSPLWLFYRGEPQEGDDLKTFLAHRKVAIGGEGTNTRKIFSKLLDLSGISAGDSPGLLGLSHREAIRQLKEEKIDAVVVLDGIDAPNVRELLSMPGINIYDFNLVNAYVKQMPYLEKVVLPRGSVSIERIFPPRDIDMLASTVTLVVEKDLHPVLQWMLLKASREIGSGRDDFFAKAGYFPADIDWSIALSPVAKQYYAKGLPAGFDYFPLWLGVLVDRFWALILAAAAAFFAATKLASTIRDYPGKKILAFSYYSMWRIERRILASEDMEAVRADLQKLRDLEAEVRGTWFSDQERRDFYTFRRRLEGVLKSTEEKLKKLEIPGNAPSQ
jgi:TRAP-type uncharacterized transport system substrate-binding protein